MCGIVGYIGDGESLPVLLTGLKALEYRGYDSAGVAIFSRGAVKEKKSLGRISVLEAATRGGDFSGSVGIAHTRWATHGVPSEVNAHPHSDCGRRVFVVHNGIIENYRELKEYLIGRGHKFLSETDTESVAHLIEDFLNDGRDFKAALFAALKMIKGAYALALVDSTDPEKLYAARLSSPLVIGVGEKEYFLASDPSALIGKTKNIIYLKDGEVAAIRRDNIEIVNFENEPTPYEIIKLEWNLEESQKGKYPHFMLKEIYEGPEVIRSAFRGRIGVKDGTVKLGGLELIPEKLKGIRRLVIAACGTSYYAGLIGEYFFEEIARIPVEVQFASEFRYRREPFDPGTAVLAVSQSGETADTLAALRKAKENGLLTLGIVNVVGSTIARETDAGIYNHAGPEIGVASTKAFLSQVTCLLLMALYLAKDKTGQSALLQELENIPKKIEKIL